MLFAIKTVIFVGMIILGIMIALEVIGEYFFNEYDVDDDDDEEEEDYRCAITDEHCRYDYSIFAGGNPCDTCEVFKKWEGESDGEL